MNLWMSDAFEYPETPLDQGKVLDAEALEAAGTFSRYKDLDNDGIGYRTLPGTDHRLAAYFTRGTGHDEHAVYSEDPDVWLENIARLNRKFETARTLVPAPVLSEAENSQFGLIAYGTTDPAVVEGRDRLREQGVEFNYLRLRALPLNDTTRQFVESHDRVYVFENNSDGQMAKVIQMEYPELASRVIPLAHLDGMPLTARRLVEMVLAKEEA